MSERELLILMDKTRNSDFPYSIEIVMKGLRRTIGIFKEKRTAQQVRIFLEAMGEMELENLFGKKKEDISNPTSAVMNPQIKNILGCGYEND